MSEYLIIGGLLAMIVAGPVAALLFLLDGSEPFRFGPGPLIVALALFGWGCVALVVGVVWTGVRLAAPLAGV